MFKSLIAAFLAYAARLRFPTLFKLTGLLFIVSLFTPIPFADEILFGLGTALLAAWKKRNDPEPPA